MHCQQTLHYNASLSVSKTRSSQSPHVLVLVLFNVLGHPFVEGGGRRGGRRKREEGEGEEEEGG